ncbi:MAG: ferritin-like domain-containing protein [Methylobacter sp.]
MNDLTVIEIQALYEALDDEYRALATYEQVLADFGEVPPFSHIREAEKRHIEALCRLFARYGLAVPENPWPGKVGRYSNLQGACETAVAAEIANAKIYERLLQATERPDILKVFRNLQKASQQNHLPAFRRGTKEFPSCSYEGDCGHR